MGAHSMTGAGVSRPVEAGLGPQHARNAAPGMQAQFEQEMIEAKARHWPGQGANAGPPFKAEALRAGVVAGAGSSAGAEKVAGVFGAGRSSDVAGAFGEKLLTLGYRADKGWIVHGSSHTLPDQGWKLHVTPATSGDAVKIAESLFPKLRDLKVPHKILDCDDQCAAHGANYKGELNSPEHKEIGSGQHGKIIAVYPKNETEAGHLAALIRDHLDETGVKNFLTVPDTKQIGDGISGRFGIIASHVGKLKKPDGTFEFEEKRQAKPEWVKDLVVPDKYDAKLAGHDGLSSAGTKPMTHTETFEKHAATLRKSEGFTIGRDAAKNDVASPSDTVSNLHARVYRDAEGRMHVHDQGSTNGTVVERDGKRIEARPGSPVEIQAGDKIKVGTSKGETYEVPGGETAFAHRVSALRIADGFCLGRAGSTADVPVQGDTVSSRHALVFRDAFGVMKVADLKSTNGTMVERGGVKLPVMPGSPLELRPGDKIRMGGGSGATLGVPGASDLPGTPQAAVTMTPVQARR